MPSDLRVRHVLDSDFSTWVPLWDAYNAFYGRTGESALPRDVTMTTWARFMDPEEPVHALVAERNGTLVGLAHYIFHRSTLAAAPSCYMQDLFTRESHRGAGVGGELIQKVYELARSSGSPRVYWQTHESNHDAMHLYDKLAERSGFIVYAKSL